MFEGDFVRSGPTEDAEPDRGDEAHVPAERWHLGLQSRALNLKPLEESGSMFNDALHSVFAFEHLGDTARRQVRKTLESKKLSAQESELLLLAIEGL